MVGFKGILRGECWKMMNRGGWIEEVELEKAHMLRKGDWEDRSEKAGYESSE